MPWRMLEPSRPYVRPPGATSGIGAVCEACTNCRDACPEQAIRFLEDGTPAIVPREKGCQLCSDLPCITACTAGALRPIAIEDVQMGEAQLDVSRCWVTIGQPCDYCAKECPRDAIDGTRVDLERCVGCGACVFICTATPSAISIRSYAK